MDKWIEVPFRDFAGGSDALQFVAGNLWRGWRLAAAGALSGLLIAVLALNLIVPEYTASMVVGPTSMLGPAAMGARAPMLKHDAVSSVAEHAPNGEDLSDFARYLHLLTSPPVAERLLGDSELVHRLYPERWDSAGKRWVEASGPLSWIKRRLLALVGRSDWVEPDADTLARTLRRRVIVDSVGTGPMRRLSFRDVDREFALGLLQRLAAATDLQLRAEAQRRINAQIDYVRDRLKNITIKEHRAPLIDLLAEQERLLMMIEIELPFAADPIEPAAVASLPDWPNVVAVLAAAVAAGLSLGAFAAGAGWTGRRRV